MRLFLAVLTIVTFLGLTEAVFADSVIVNTPGKPSTMCIRIASGVLVCQ